MGHAAWGEVSKVFSVQVRPFTVPGHQKHQSTKKPGTEPSEKGIVNELLGVLGWLELLLIVSSNRM